MALTPQQWQRAEDLFDRCFNRTPEDCECILTEECSDDFALREAVRELLASARPADDFLEIPVIKVSSEGTIRASPHVQLIGSVLNERFAVLKLVGTGGMGEVYQAHDNLLGRSVAIKVLRRELMRNPDWRPRLEREARAISSLNHPHICAIYDFHHDSSAVVGTGDHLSYLVMEYLSGETLSEHISRGPLPLTDLSRIAVQIAEALAYAHKHEIIHRDLKPSNVLLTESGVKLLDFGLAKPIKVNSDPSANSITKAGMLLGSINYMSPEQAQGQALDVRSDIFSFGCVLYEMATRQRAFPGDDLISTLAGVLQSEPVPPRELVPGLPPLLDQIVRRCLHKHPEDRYQEMSEVLSDLKAIEETQAYKQEDDRQPGALNFRKVVARGSRLSTRWIVSFAVTGAVLISTALLNIVSLRRHNSAMPFENTQLSKLTANGNANLLAAISPDGNSIVYAIEQNGTFVLRLKPIRGGQSMLLGRPFSTRIKDINFTGGGAYVSVVTHPSSQPAMCELWILPVDGGAPQQILDTFSGPVSVSPDGTQVAYVIADTKASRDELWMSNTDGTKRRFLRFFPKSDRITWNRSFEWSPDGTLLACALQGDDRHGSLVRLAAVEIGTGKMHQIPSPKAVFI